MDSPCQITRHTGAPGDGCAAGDDRLADERVADPVHGANHAAIIGRISERFAKLRDERRKAGLGDMNPRPERGVQLLVRHGVRLVPDEGQQQFEGFRREMDLDSLPSDQARADVDDNCAHPFNPSSSAQPRIAELLAVTKVGD